MRTNSSELTGSLQREYFRPTYQANLRSTASQREGAQRALACIDAVTQTYDPKIAREVVARLLDRCTTRQPLPPLIARFFETDLRIYLTSLCIAESEYGQNWHDACHYIEKLVWSVQPKHNKEDSKKLYALLPALTQWVHNVFESTHLAVTEEDAFFSGLAKLHVVALKLQRNPIAESATGESNEKSSPHRKRLAHRCDVAERNADIAQTRSRLSGQLQTNQLPKLGNAGSDLLSTLHVGACFEFISERAAIRVMRLKWISGQGSVFLFQDQHTGDEVCLTAMRLDQRLGEHSVRALNCQGRTVSFASDHKAAKQPGTSPVGDRGGRFIKDGVLRARPTSYMDEIWNWAKSKGSLVRG
jgi:hypothetical protein